MNNTGQSIWDRELELLALTIYKALHTPHDGIDIEIAWEEEPFDVQRCYMSGALAARQYIQGA